MGAHESMEHAEHAEHASSSNRNIALLIAVIALFLALSEMLGKGAQTLSISKNVEASNLWAFFQAKNLRRQALRLQIDQLEIMRDGDPNLPATTRAAVEAKIADYKAQDTLLTSDKARNEGLDELFVRAKALEVERDTAMERDPYFDYGEAFLQIAIVLGGVAIISGGSAVLVSSLVVAALGALMTLNGFTLLVPMPFIG